MASFRIHIIEVKKVRCYTKIFLSYNWTVLFFISCNISMKFPISSNYVYRNVQLKGIIVNKIKDFKL